MINLQNANKIVKQLDQLLTNITALIKKHWKILLLIFACICVYGYLHYNVIYVEEPVGVQDTTAVQPIDTLNTSN
jgi:hypothetical protein